MSDEIIMQSELERPKVGGTGTLLQRGFNVSLRQTEGYCEIFSSGEPATLPIFELWTLLTGIFVVFSLL